MLPNLFVIGAMKCATSTICRYLEEHPEVYFLPRAEPNFFSRDENWAQGLGAYEAKFADAGDVRYVGEGSNSYTILDLFPEAPARLASVAPEAKLIYCVRHPVERLVSAWAQLRLQSPDQIAFDINQAVRENPDYIVYPSFYGRQVEAYRQRFPEGALFVGLLEDIKRDQADFFGRLCSFLDLAPLADQGSAGLWANKTGDRAVLGPGYNHLKAAPGIEFIKKFAPAGLRHALKKRLSTPTPGTAELMAQLDLPDALRRELKDDAARLLDYAGKPADFWRI